MTEREALKLALAALKQIDEAMPFPVAKLAIMKAEEALAQPEQFCGFDVVLDESMPPDTFKLVQPDQEPVAWTEGEDVYWHTNPSLNDWIRANGTPLFTTPPQRTWVGLTDEEIDQGLLRSDYAFKMAEAWRSGVVFAMTKLKEKNT